MMEEYYKPELLNMQAHADLSEKWVQGLIAKDPSILGLGDLELRGQERTQPRAGRLDLLLQDPETFRRYEVELQLGPTDETHIIRTIEYWDIERKRYPQYDHCAVIIAEDITARFFNVISLFNGSIPLIAIQMRALKVDGKLTLVFTKVVDELTRGVVDEDEEASSAPADRAYWDERASKATMQMTDDLFALAKGCDSSLEMKFNKPYIGLSRAGVAFNFVSFKPKKKNLQLDIKLPRTNDVDAKIDAAGFDTLDYSARWSLYRLRLTAADIKAKSDALSELITLAYTTRAT